MFPLLHHQEQVRMAERSKALRSGRSPLLWAWVRIPLLTTDFFSFCLVLVNKYSKIAEWRSGSVLGP